MEKQLYTKVTSKGQITIPAPIRNKMHLDPGIMLEFIKKDGYIMVVPLNQSVTKLKGFLPKPKTSLSCEQMDDIIQCKN